MRSLITILALGCSGPTFEVGEFDNVAGNSAAIAGEASEAGAGARAGSFSGGSESVAAGGRDSSVGGSAAGSSDGGATAMAGGPAMGEGGSGEGGNNTGAAKGPSECLAGFQSLECAKVCTNSASDCQSVLNCFIQNNSNSLDNCSQFTNVGISLAQSAERTCCNDD